MDSMLCTVALLDVGSLTDQIRPLPTSTYYSTLKVEAGFSSETLVHVYQTTPSYISQDSSLHTHLAMKVLNK
jgi:hypothetical protein